MSPCESNRHPSRPRSPPRDSSTRSSRTDRASRSPRALPAAPRCPDRRPSSRYRQPARPGRCNRRWPRPARPRACTTARSVQTLSSIHPERPRCYGSHPCMPPSRSCRRAVFVCGDDARSCDHAFGLPGGTAPGRWRWCARWPAAAAGTARLARMNHHVTAHKHPQGANGEPAAGGRWQAALLTVGRLGFDYGCLLAAQRATGTSRRPSWYCWPTPPPTSSGSSPHPGRTRHRGGQPERPAGPGRRPPRRRFLATLAYRIASYWLPLLAGPPAYLLFRHRYGKPTPRPADHQGGDPEHHPGADGTTA